MDFFYFWQDQDIRELVVSAALGAVIGLERDLSGKDPSLRTFALICMASCLFSMMSRYAAALSPTADPARIAAQILPGIGFLGAGAIFRGQRGVSGITTATLMWTTSAIGMAVGFHKIDLAVSATIVSILAIYSLKMVHRLLFFLRSNRANETATQVHRSDE